MIKTFYNFLEFDFIQNLKKTVKDKIFKNEWITSLCWIDSVKKSSQPVLIMKLTDEVEIYQYFQKKYNEVFSETINKKIEINYYLWPRLSFIPFHSDGKNRFASTIYLNESWDKDLGGLYLYEQNNEIKALVPTFNMCVFNNDNLYHGTSLTTVDAPYRETVQLFFYS